MPWVREKGIIVVSAIVLFNVVWASPSIQLPVNSQVPPVARISQPYAFVFAESTFTSTTGPITYALSDNPAWLQVDGPSRTLLGRPGSSDDGLANFQLIATDAQGSTPLSVRLIVVQDGVVEVGRSTFSQLAGFGLHSSPSSILFYQLQSFSFNFSPDTFIRTSSSTRYYAISEDNSPLPSWLQFEASILGFSGTTPPLVSPTVTPQTYGVKLIASDIPGYLEASATFHIVVGYHILAFSATSENVTATPGEEVATSPLRQWLTLDGRAVPGTDIASVTANAPSWLALDKQNISLNGISPADATDFTVTISVLDVLGNVANATVNVSFTSNLTRLFLGDAPTANATIGQVFHYTISRSILLTGDVIVMANLGSASAWLAFDPSNLSFSGRVPRNLVPGLIDIGLSATLEHKTDEETLRVNILRGSATTSVPHVATLSTSFKSFSSSASPPFTSPSTAKHSHPSRDNLLKIVLAVVLSTVALIVLLTLFMCCHRRERKVSISTNPHMPDPSSAPPAAEQIDSEPRNAGAAESIQSEEIQRHATPNEPPRVELSWAPDSRRKSRAELSNRINVRYGGFQNLSFSGSLPQDSESPVPDSKPKNDARKQFQRRSSDWTPFVSTRTSNYSRKRISPRLVQSKTEQAAAPERASRPLSGITTATLSLPYRLSGAGHGAGGFGSSEYNDIRSSWRRAENPLQTIENKGTTVDIIETLPQLPPETRGRNRANSSERKGKASLKLVTVSSSQTDSTAEESQGWYTERIRDTLERPARFFHPSPSRQYSGGGYLEAGISTADHDGQLTSPNSPHPGWSQKENTHDNRTFSRPSIRPLFELLRERSTASSGQFDSALSMSSSQWEDEILTAEIGFQDEGALQTIGSVTRDGQTLLRSRATVATVLSEVSSAAELDRSPASRKLRLEDVPGQRLVTIGNCELQESERSHQGSLAFV